MIPPEVSSPLLAAAQDGFNRIKDVSFNSNSSAGRAACSEQAAKLRAMETWGIQEPGREGFYACEANADPARAKEFILRAIGYYMATLAKLDGLNELGPLWKLFGLVKGDAALELIQLKESASAILQEAQNMQEKAEKEVRAMREQVASSARQIAEMEALIETTQTRAAETVAKKDVLIQERDRKIQEQEATIAKLRTELQAALAKPKATPPTTPPVAAPNAADVEELKRLKTQVAEQAVKIADQAAKIERYSNAKETCVDGELLRAVEFVMENFDKPAMADFVKWAVHFVRTSIDGRA